MKAKNFIPVILAAMTITAAGCSAEPEVWEYEIGNNTLINEETAAFIEAIRPEAPIYANYLVESSALPSAVSLSYETNGVAVTMETYMVDLDEMVVTTITNGVTNDVILKDGTYYMVSDAEKTALYMNMTEEQQSAMIDAMVSSVQSAFNPETASFETGKTEYNGTEYLYEKITTAEAGEIMIYADKKTKDVKYIQNAGQIMEINFLEHEISDSIFEIPADYTMTDMATMAG